MATTTLATALQAVTVRCKWPCPAGHRELEAGEDAEGLPVRDRTSGRIRLALGWDKNGWLRYDESVYGPECVISSPHYWFTTPIARK